MFSFVTSRFKAKPSPVLALLGLTLLAAAVRFPALGAKSYWGDEVSTLFLVRHGFGHMFAGIAQLESTPPLYYVLAKLWYSVAGSGEEGMRSLPALIGVATVPAAYAAARELVSSRAAWIAAALVAVNPMLVWYSGEARAYSLVVLLSTVGLWCFARALRGRRYALAGWAIASSLALATHYFAAFLIVPEAVLLVQRRGLDKRLVAALTPVAGTAAALLPLAMKQRSFGHATWIENGSLPLRVLRAPLDLLVGFDAPHAALVGALALVLAVVGCWLAWRRVRNAGERRGLRLAAIVGASGVGLPLFVAAFGLDYFNSRNVLAVIVPLTIAVAAGFATLRRAAAVIPVALFSLCIAVVAATANEPKYHSEDWRASVSALGSDRHGARAVVVTPGQAGRKPLMVYLGEGTQPLRRATARVSELDLVVAPQQGAARPSPIRVRRLESLQLPGFRRVARRAGRHYVAIRLRARSPQSVPVRLILLRFRQMRPAVLLEQ